MSMIKDSMLRQGFEIPAKLSKFIGVMVSSGIDITNSRMVSFEKEHLTYRRPGCSHNDNRERLTDVEICDGVFKSKIDDSYFIYSEIPGIINSVCGIMLPTDMHTRVAILDIQSKCFMNRDI